MREVLIVGAGMAVGALAGFPIGAYIGEKEDQGSDFPIALVVYGCIGSGWGIVAGGLLGAYLS